MCFFFFSSRRRHTRWNCDWSSDVCSSDLNQPGVLEPAKRDQHDVEGRGPAQDGESFQLGLMIDVSTRSSQIPLIRRYAGAWPSTLNPHRSSTAALRAFR